MERDQAVRGIHCPTCQSTLVTLTHTPAGDPTFSCRICETVLSPGEALFDGFGCVHQTLRVMQDRTTDHVWSNPETQEHYKLEEN
jgi:hypothetical protein